MRVMRDESFGPVVGIMPVEGRRTGFGADERLPVRPDRLAVDAGRRAGSAHRREIETGTVFMNRADYLDPALCWTGCKDTGRGGSLSEIGFHNLTRPKSYHLRKNPT
jgi:acyl-CoA reductase-like NAD-dependent aldehyde dehydrogenase